MSSKVGEVGEWSSVPMCTASVPLPHHHHNFLDFMSHFIYTQQGYCGLQYGTLLHSYCTGAYTEVVSCFFEVAPLLPWSTHAGTPTE